MLFLAYITSKSMTLIYDPSGSSNVKSDGANRKSMATLKKSYRRPTSYLSPFSRYFESKNCDLDLQPFKIMQSKANMQSI